jgi:uncharacterized protein
MIVDLAETERWPHEFDLRIEIQAIDLETATIRLKGAIGAIGKIEKHAAWFDVEGLIETEAEIECSRCLEPVERRLSIPFDIRFINADSGDKGVEREIDPNDLSSSVLADDRIDLKELVREQILLDLPEQVFCKEDCRGLCPKCGANRNLIDCTCEDDDIDPRWAALKNLK